MKANYITVKDVDTWATIEAMGDFEDSLGDGELWWFNQRLYYLSALELPINHLLDLAEFQGGLRKCACDFSDSTVIFRIDSKELKRVEKYYQKFKESGLFSVKEFFISYFGEDALGNDYCYYSAVYKCTNKNIAERFFNLAKEMQHYSNYLKAGVSVELQNSFVVIEQYEH